MRLGRDRSNRAPSTEPSPGQAANAANGYDFQKTRVFFRESWALAALRGPGFHETGLALALTPTQPDPVPVAKSTVGRHGCGGAVNGSSQRRRRVVISGVAMSFTTREN